MLRGVDDDRVLEVKRAASVVRCHDCGKPFPLSKTRQYQILTGLGAGAGASADDDGRGGGGKSAGGGRAVDVCFLCAPRWQMTKTAGRDHSSKICITVRFTR